MGGSSSQTIGQRYFAKLTTFIGNPIEKLIGVNFDNRGWIFKPDNDESFLRVESPNLYGDKEGGVAGFIDIHTGTADQLPNATYSADFPKVSGYPFQSYLVFRGLGRGVSAGGVVGEIAGIIAKRHHYNKSFYHGNSGYMKEMLLWPQRIHVKNDGSAQWYDSRAEIDGSNYYTPAKSSTYQELQVLNRLSMYWNDKDGTHNRYVGGAQFPLTELRKGFEASIGENGPQIPEPPGYIAASELLSNNGVSINPDDMTIIPEPTWTSYPPTTDGFWDGAIVRMYTATGSFFWAGGIFQYRAFLSNNFSAIIISDPKDNNMIVDIRPTRTKENYQCIEGEIYIPKGRYNIRAEFGERYATQGTPRPFVHFQVKAMPYDETESPDINPIHKIREILTDDTAMGKPESDVNDINFMKAADRIWNEGLGISWSITEKSCLEAINELCSHIEAGVRMNRQTGLYEMVLFRDDWFAVNEVHTLPVNKIKGMQLHGATSADELINKLNVSYYNQSAIKNSSFSIAENAAIRNLKGHENSEDVKFPYFMNQRNAAVVAQWKLKQISTPVWQGTFTTGFYEARKWNRYDLLKLAWPKRWNGTILVRIMKINLGTGTDVSIDFVEVVPYSGNLSLNIVNDTPVDTTPKPPLPALFKAFELSYLEAVQLNGQKSVDDALAYNPDAGYAAVIAQRPQNNSLNALMYTDIGNDFERAGVIVYSETAELDQSLSKMDHAFIVKKAGDIDMVSTGTQITVNNEIMVYQSYDKETGLLTVKRGALDTIPQNHLAGSILYFADDFVTVDPTEYVTGEIVNVKTLTTTPSGILNLDDVDAQQVEIKARANRPYPPANVKINGEYWPAEIETDLIITWVDRNRAQQTGGTPLGWFDEGVVIESGVTTHLRLAQYDKNQIELATNSANVSGTNTFTFPISSMQADTQTVEITLKTTRDGFDCLSPFVYTIELSTFYSAPYDITYIVSDL